MFEGKKNVFLSSNFSWSSSFRLLFYEREREKKSNKKKKIMKTTKVFLVLTYFQMISKMKIRNMKEIIPTKTPFGHCPIMSIIEHRSTIKIIWRLFNWKIPFVIRKNNSIRLTTMTREQITNNIRKTNQADAMTKNQWNLLSVRVYLSRKWRWMINRSIRSDK